MHKRPLIRRPNAQLERQRLLALINSMTDGVIAVDKKMRVVLYNGAALGILDRNTIDNETYLRSIFAPSDKNDHLIDIESLIKDTSAPTTNRDLRLAYQDGSTINLYLAISPVRLGYGQSQENGYVLQLRDITREKSLEEERDEFINVISHELRTPVAIVEGHVSNAQFIASRDGKHTQIEEALQAAHDQIEFLAGMLNDLAMLSRADRGKLSVEISTINAHRLIESLATNYATQAKSHGLRIISEIDPALSILHSSDLYVREILQNFITNALKYTQKGGITLSAQAQPGGVEFAVIDTGIGISRSDQARIFHKFFRSEDYHTRATIGTGLGLYVSAKLAKLIQAKITVDSQLGHGSTFRIFIPDLKSTYPSTQG